MRTAQRVRVMSIVAMAFLCVGVSVVVGARGHEKISVATADARASNASKFAVQDGATANLDAAAQSTANKDGARTSVADAVARTTNKAGAQSGAAGNSEAAAQIEKFGKLVAGEWILEGSAKASPSFPKGRLEKGRTVIKFGPGRLSLIENMHVRSESGATDDAVGIFWWDKEAQGYRSAFCDTFDPNGCSVYDGIGRWKGDAVVFHFEFVTNGKKQPTVEEIHRTGPDSFTAVMSHPGRDGTETQPFTWKHTRAGK